MLWPERAKEDGNEGNTYQHPNPDGQEDPKILCLSLRDGTNFSIPISDATNSSEVMQVISHLDNCNKRIHFIKGSTIPVTLLYGREVILSHEPSFAKAQQEPITLTERDLFMITSRCHNKNMALAHLKDDQVKTIRRKKRDGTVKSRVVTETLWYKDPEGILESSDIIHV